MLTYEILRPRPAAPPQTGVVAKIMSHIRGSNSVVHGWDKVKYAKWIEEVKKEFKTGDLVTMKGIPFVPGNAPKCVMSISYIQEIHYLAVHDEVLNEPKAMALLPIGVAYDKPLHLSPRLLRKLNPEELQFVDLRDKKKPQQQQQRGVEYLDGKPVVVDEAGRILSASPDNDQS